MGDLIGCLLPTPHPPTPRARLGTQVTQLLANLTIVPDCLPHYPGSCSRDQWSGLVPAGHLGCGGGEGMGWEHRSCGVLHLSPIIANSICNF